MSKQHAEGLILAERKTRYGTQLSYTTAAGEFIFAEYIDAEGSDDQFKTPGSGGLRRLASWLAGIFIQVAVALTFG